MIRLTKLGIKSLSMILAGEICPPIQSMVVVTSPIGVQAPPAFAAIMTIPTKSSRSFWFRINFRSNETITIVVVKLFKTAERKKVIKPTIQTNLRLSVWAIKLVIISKPSWASINSTIVIAPSRKKRILEISPKWDNNDSFTSILFAVKRIYTNQHNTPVIRAVAVLLILIPFSNAIAA